MANHNTQLEIFTIYRSNNGKEISLHNITNDEDMMDIERYQPSNFWNCGGRISVHLTNLNVHQKTI